MEGKWVTSSFKALNSALFLSPCSPGEQCCYPGDLQTQQCRWGLGARGWGRGTQHRAALPSVLSSPPPPGTTWSDGEDGLSTKDSIHSRVSVLTGE